MVLQLERDVHTVQMPWDELGCRAARRAGYSVTATPQPQAFQRSSPLRPVPNRPPARAVRVTPPFNIQNSSIPHLATPSGKANQYFLWPSVRRRALRYAQPRQSCMQYAAQIRSRPHDGMHSWGNGDRCRRQRLGQIQITG